MKRWLVWSFLVTVALALLPLHSAVAQTCDQPFWNPIARFPEPSQGPVRHQVPIASDPVVAMNNDGRLEVFAIGVDGGLWHSSQTTDRQGWNDIASLGSPAGHPLKASSGSRTLAAISDRLGNMNVFVITDGIVWTIRQLAFTPVENWAAWQRLPVIAHGTPQQLWVAPNLDGHIELFVEHDQTLNHTWQMQDLTWFNLFVEFGWPQGAYDQLAVMRDRAGRLVAAAVTANEIFVRRQITPNVDWAPWTSISSPAPGGLGPLVGLATNEDGRLELLAELQIRDDRQPTQGIYDVEYWHTWQTDDKTWSGAWGRLGAPFPFAQWRAIDATITQNLGGCPVVTAFSAIRSNPADPKPPDLRLSPLYQKHVNADWDTWRPGRGTESNVDVSGHPAVAERSDNYLEMFVRATDGTWLHASQNRNQILH